MQRFNLFYTQSWYLYLQPPERELIQISLELLAREERLNSSFSDYSFIVFPFAKAYEGFLKKFFYDMSLISRDVYESHRFRIGRALNPDLAPHQQDEQWLYQRIVEQCDAEVAHSLWFAWLTCRNHLFHFFPDMPLEISLQQASSSLELLANTMQHAVECQSK
jgi:hypothetical protein